MDEWSKNQKFVINELQRLSVEIHEMRNQLMSIKTDISRFKTIVAISGTTLPILFMAIIQIVIKMT